MRASRDFGRQTHNSAANVFNRFSRRVTPVLRLVVAQKPPTATHQPRTAAWRQRGQVDNARYSARESSADGRILLHGTAGVNARVNPRAAGMANW
jgi:hypothetical protein